MTRRAAPSVRTGWPAVAEVIRAPHVAAFLIGRTLAAMGSWMERLGIGWLMWQATGSPGWLGVLAFLRLAPIMLLGPYGGVLADRSGALRVLQSSHLALALLTGAIAVAAAAGALGPPSLCAAAFLLGSAQALANAPAKTAVADVAPRRLLATAIPMNSVGFNTATFIGPAVAGVILAASGAAWVFVVASATALGFAAILARIPRGEPGAPALEPAMPAFVAASRYAARHPAIAPALWLHLAFSLLLRPVIDFLPAVAGRLPGGGAGTLGLLTATLGLGAMAGGLWLAWRGAAPGLGRRIAIGGMVAALALAALAVTGRLALAAPCLGVLGAAMVVRGSGAQSLVQLMVAAEFRGRVMGLWGMVLRGGGALGGLGLGLAAEVVGLGPALFVSALLCFCAVAATWTRLRDAAPETPAP